MTDAELEALLRDAALEEREPLDPRWEKYTRGELSDAEAEALVASDPERAELFRPLPVEPIVAELPRAPAFADAPSANTPWRFGALLALVAAAALALFVMVPRPGDPLPAYTIAVSGGVKDIRGEEPDRPPLLAPSAPVRLRLRPATQTDLALTAEVWSGSVRLEAVEVTVTESGAVAIDVRDAPSGTETLQVRLVPTDDPTQVQTFDVAIRTR